MKRFFLTLLSLFIACSMLPTLAIAQQNEEGDEVVLIQGDMTSDVELTTPQVARKRFDLTGSHDFRLSIAYNPYTPNGYAPNQVDWPSFPTLTPLNSIIGKVHWYTLSGEYSCYVKRWLRIGFAASWTGGVRTIWSSIDHRRVDRYHYNSVALLPKIHFSYLNREVIQLYSSLGVGGAFAIYDNVPDNTKEHRFDISLDATFIGMSIGKRLFGYFEIGVGTQGTLRAGIGYRFNNKNN